MTADERIEALVNCFGQTICDLPKPDKDKFAYLASHRGFTEIAVNEWCQHETDLMLLIDKYRDYICHLADVIDRMEAALDTALNLINCPACESFGWPEVCKDCAETNNYRIADVFLHDIENPDEIVLAMDDIYDGDDAHNDNQG